MGGTTGTGLNHHRGPFNHDGPIYPDEERNLEMERIETLNLKTETDALEAGHGITLYTFDEYGRLMHYAHIVASTPKEREDGYADYFLTIFKGGDDMRRFDPDDGNDYTNFESIIESIKTIWSNTPIWWERDGSVPGVDAGITFDELRGASMLAGFRRQLERNMRVRGIDPEGGQVERDARTIAEAETRPYVPSLFDLFEESIVEGVNRLESDGVEREARNAWERGIYREMLHAMKD